MRRVKASRLLRLVEHYISQILEVHHQRPDLSMAAELDLKSLEQAFQGRADLQGAIKSAASTYSYL